jgi:aminomethyltransferase
LTELAATALHDEHVRLGGRMVAFAGYSMPVQYAGGALREYHAVRDGGAGVFDISHMGQVRVSGKDALACLQYVTTNDVSRLADGQVQYAALLNEHGTFIDDITVYRMSEKEYYLCVNAANRHRDVVHLQRQAAGFNVAVSDESDDTALLALQGAAAQTFLQPLTDRDLEHIAYYRFALTGLAGVDAIVSRTGYTGEDGFEIYLPNEAAAALWQRLLEAGAEPVGLAARDMLRTEMGYALYGHEIGEDVTPVEAKLMWITKMDKGEFIGREAVAARRAEGPQKVLTGLKLTERGIPREQYRVVADGSEAGIVTSGIHSPLAGGGVALAYVAPEYAQDGDLAVEIRGRRIPAVRIKPPFVRSNVRK